MVIEPAAGERRARGVNPARALVLGFAGLILVGTLLLALPFAAAPGVDISWLDAFFTATSAVCVTGLAVVNTAEAWSPFGQAVILILIQVGGLGLMTMSTLIALLLGKRITLRERLLIQVSLQEFSLSGLVRLTRYVLLATLMLEAIGTLILTLRFGPEHGWRRGLWLGVFHAVSAFNNAGFDLFGNSLIDYVGDVTVIGTIAGLIMLGGLGFSVLVDLFRWPRVGWRGLSLHSKVVLSATAALVVVPTLAILAFEYNNPATLAGLGWKNKLLAAFFQAVTPRTAGFNSLAIDGMRAPSLLLMTILMFIGGSPGSTAGGIKTTTAMTILSVVRATLAGSDDVELFQRRLDRSVTDRALTVFLAASLVVMTATMLLLIADGYDLMATLFEVVSAFGTVGLSTGITPDLSPAGQLILIVTMFLGRVGPLTFAFALARRRQGRQRVRLPEERLTIG